ncbi:hypothetical protein BDV98DRAFT_565282 [Pterulicium gracile]|uniref:Uncharacterized protein n=1 Tax=Pterulicium gracile TaxID=1884261 RepID=A0A5C3QR83_9AGAR|nr:hypothetical protein BDV98DRAFT_565282 [Pterula gracilis]
MLGRKSGSCTVMIERVGLVVSCYSCSALLCFSFRFVFLLRSSPALHLYSSLRAKRSPSLLNAGGTDSRAGQLPSPH